MDISSSGRACREAGWTSVVARQFVNVLDTHLFGAQTKKNPGKPGFFQSEGLSLNDLNVRSLFTFGSRRHIERDFLVLFERLEASRLNRREMREKIVATAIGSDKAKTFSVVKPFNRTCCHISYPKS